MSKDRSKIINARQVEQKITRMAHEIYEHHFEEKELVIVGITKRGYILAERIATILEDISPLNITLLPLTLDKKNPHDSPVDENFRKAKLAGKVVLLTDDVLNSGRTLMYGVKHILEHPVKKLATVILVNRRHRLYPIRADFVGITLSTTLKEHITVELKKGKEAVYLE